MPRTSATLAVGISLSRFLPFLALDRLEGIMMLRVRTKFFHDHCRTETDSTTLIDLFQDLEPRENPRVKGKRGAELVFA